jgi:hypothetical protein
VMAAGGCGLDGMGMVVFRRHRQGQQRGGGGGLPAILEKIFGTIRNKLEQDTKDTFHRQTSRHISLTSLCVPCIGLCLSGCMLHRAASATLDDTTTHDHDHDASRPTTSRRCIPPHTPAEQCVCSISRHHCTISQFARRCRVVQFCEHTGSKGREVHAGSRNLRC